MASLIDPSKPAAGHATTDSVRKNFQFAKQDIEYMQNQVDALIQRVQELENIVGELMPPGGGVVTGDIVIDGRLTVNQNTTLMAPVEMKSTAILDITPIGDNEAATKGYVDNAIASIPALDVFPTAATLEAMPSDPIGTTATTYRMMGLAGILVSSRDGRILVTINGRIQNSSQNQSTLTVICVGTGTPPANGAIQANTNGAMVGALASFEAASNSSPFAPFSLTTLFDNVIADTTYWIDLAVRVTGGTGTVADINITAVEIL